MIQGIKEGKGTASAADIWDLVSELLPPPLQ
jgi:hypothetical protein